MSFVDAAADILGDALAPYALFYSTSRFIGTIVMDVTVREIHSDENTITIHPVETGTPISDHIFRNPAILEVVCAASDSTAGYPGYVQEVYEAFLALRDTRDVFDVGTGKRFYENMQFGNITVATDETSEFALMVTARLQEIIITDSAGDGSGMTATNQASPQDTAPAANVGTQGLQPAPGVSASATIQAQGGVLGSASGGAAVGLGGSGPTDLGEIVVTR